MSIKDILQTAAENITSHAGEGATYTPASGDPVTCNVILAHDALIQADGYDISTATLGTTIQAMVSDVGTVNRGDTFSVESVTYTVVRQSENDGVMVVAVVK